MTDNAKPAVSSTVERLVEQFYSPGVKWRTYPNPMRSDGVFVAEDKPIEPYPGVSRIGGSPIYPATPQTQHAIPFQLPHDQAAELVRMLNAEGEVRAASARTLGVWRWDARR